MKLTYFGGDGVVNFGHNTTPNFGDELNPWLWKRILPPGFLDEDRSELFVGIGSILWDHLPHDSLKHVVGSGYGGYTRPPNVHDGAWNIVFVRGPRTADLLGIERDKVVSDGAILIRYADVPPVPRTSRIAFIPHFQSADRGLWRESCDEAGIDFIDPRDPVEIVLERIGRSKLVIAGAMHGAIVADALRTPWVAALPLSPEHHMKWLDWTGSLSIALRPHHLLPTSLLELLMQRTHGRGQEKSRPFLESRVATPFNRMLWTQAARQLRLLGRQEPQLSADADMERASERARSALDAFVRQRDGG